MEKLLTIRVDASEEELRGLLGNPEGEMALSGWISGLAQVEVNRLRHIERCRPKPRVPKQAGRPVEEARGKQVRELGDELRDIFLKLKKLYGQEYGRLFGNQEQDLEGMIARGELEGLLDWAERKPWLRKGKG